jgi:two-component system, OmpR family, KDP operon response regulator KdpE
MAPGVGEQSLVLVVEDDEATSRLLKLSLEDENTRVIVGDAAAAALKLLALQRPALVLIDMRLPDIDGAELTARLKHESDLPVIVVTAGATSAARLEAVQNGADDFCVKPFDPDALAERVRFLLRPLPPPTAEASDVGRGLLVDRSLQAIWRDGRPVRLSKTEWTLLELLVARQGRTVAATDLYACVPEGWADLHIVDLLVARLNVRLATGAPIIVKREAGYALQP